MWRSMSRETRDENKKREKELAKKWRVKIEDEGGEKRKKERISEGMKEKYAEGKNYAAEEEEEEERGCWWWRRNERIVMVTSNSLSNEEKHERTNE